MVASPSPMSENATAVTTMAAPGKNDSHHCAPMKGLPSWIIWPHSGVGGWIPRPREETDAARSSAYTRAEDAKTRGWLITLGRRRLPGPRSDEKSEDSPA